MLHQAFLQLCVLTTLFNLAASAAFVPGWFERRQATVNNTTPSIKKLTARATVVGPAYGIIAQFQFTGYLDGKGTYVRAAVLKGLSTGNTAITGGPYKYHIHTNPIGPDYNCSQALAHLDPLQVTEGIVCDPAFPQYCQEGDLSGKHGTLNATDNGAIEPYSYTDDYLRWFPEDFSLLGRSIVIHAPNKTRIACGNIISDLDGTATSEWQPTWIPSTYVKNYPTAAPTQPNGTFTPFVGDAPPDFSSDVFKNLTFPLANAAHAIREYLNVNLTMVPAQRTINYIVTDVTLPVDAQSTAPPPFPGVDNGWIF